MSWIWVAMTFLRFRHLFLSFRLVKGDVEKLLVCVPGGRFPEGVARAASFTLFSPGSRTHADPLGVAA
ncbi:hypothetical protein CSV75_15000 [Sporosarcina sp. P18a]|nr:hypothetical protein CSV75_15000 [Sporosarcina sp. P18a]